MNKNLVYYFHLVDNNKLIKTPENFKSTLIDDAVIFAKKLAKESNDTVLLSYLQNNKHTQHSIITSKGNVLFIN